MNSLLSLFFIFAFSVYLCLGRTGVDISVATTNSVWDCLMNEKNVTYAIVRVYRCIGAIDSNSANSIALAAKSGVKDLGAYIFPCLPNAPYNLAHNITCSSPEDQVDEIIRYLHQNGIFIGENSSSTLTWLDRIWIDIEDETPSKYYDVDVIANQKFISSMTAHLGLRQAPVGIYTTKTYWQNIMGNIEGYSSYPLWYPRYDGINNLDFFSSFGGWQEVYIKQTGGDANWCNILVDPDYML